MESFFADNKFGPDRRPAVLDDIKVHYREQKRFVECFCGREVHRSIIPHLKSDHPTVWQEWVEHFVELRGFGLSLKKIMRLYRAGNGPLLFSWTVIDRAVRKAVESGFTNFNPMPTKTVAQWEPENFQIPGSTVWDFPNRGNWAVHSGDYRGNWPPQLVRSLILKYTEPGDTIVDPFVGGGTTLIEAWLNGRKSVGIDVSKLALQTSRAKIAEMRALARDDPRITLPEELLPIVVDGDALRLETEMRTCGITPGTVALICAHPPYMDSIVYTDGDRKDLSQVRDTAVFYDKLETVAKQSYKVLAPHGVFSMLIGDVRKGGKLLPLGMDGALLCRKHGFTLESIIVKIQNNNRSGEFYHGQRPNIYLLKHEYLFIFRK